MHNYWKLLVATHFAAGLMGYSLAPSPERLETTVTHNGFFETDTKRVLAAAVESLRAENRLQVYGYKGFAAVSVERDGFLFLNGRQDLIVPAAVSYFVDLSKLTAVFDEATQVVTVQLPPLMMGDVAFEPEGARSTNGGLLTFDQDQVEELTKLNYGTARKAFVKQAQGRTVVEAAERQAKANVERALELPLRIVGKPDIRVVARFSPSG